MLSASRLGTCTRTFTSSPQGSVCRLPLLLNMAQRRSVTTAAAAAGAGAGNDDVQGAMLEPSVVNTPWGRALGVTAAVAATAYSTTVMPSQAANFVHLLAFGIFLGTNVWNTFFVGLTMFKNMPRQMFGRVQSKLFPMFFALTTGANLVLLGSLQLSPAGLAGAPQNAVAALGVSAVSSLANWLFIEPKTTGLMFERYAIENKPSKSADDEADIKRLYKKFGMWHGISSLNNLVVLAATVAYGWILAGRLSL
eukprot:GHRQ01002573.1.p1 GENE.GHRQ01002573.1~~GHRQ01002573.1.p1  ORF type:complete len:252 (+),score=85.74 GHRQ01002573.1:140-895(+)